MMCKRCNQENVHGDIYCRGCEVDLGIHQIKLSYNQHLCVECQSIKKAHNSDLCEDCKHKLIMKRVANR